MTTSASLLRRSAQRLFQVALLPVFALALTVAVWAALALQSSVERQSSHAEAVAHSQALARVLAEHVGHYVRQSGHATQLFSLKHTETGGQYSLASFAQRDGLLASVLPVRLELPMAVLDQDGATVDAIHGYAPANHAGAPFFRTLATNRSGAAHVSTPVLDARSGKWQIRVARRLAGRDGQFSGAIVIMIDPNLFIDDFDRVNIGERGAMLLMTPGRQAAGRAGERLFFSSSLAFLPQRELGAPV